MSTKWAFVAGFVFAKVLLGTWVLLHFLGAPDSATTPLLWAFIGMNTAMVAAFGRILSGSPTGDVPVRNAIDGGATRHFAENPQKIPEPIKAAVLEESKRNGDNSGTGGFDPPAAPGGE